tara:strand:+ start:2158 stop:2415 length:258 start_codon:yes stop_codon:yes gene_type:complete
MAVSRREKTSDAKFSRVIGTRPSSSSREFEIDDVIEDLRDDVNDLSDLANLVEGFTFGYTAASGRVPAKLTITHVSSNTRFVVEA